MFCSSCGQNCSLEAKYCHKCGDRLQQNVTEREASVDELIEGYFHHGHPYQATVGLLEKQGGVRMHVRTLKRRLKMTCDLQKKPVASSGTRFAATFIFFEPSTTLPAPSVTFCFRRFPHLWQYLASSEQFCPQEEQDIFKFETGNNMASRKSWISPDLLSHDARA